MYGNINYKYLLHLYRVMSHTTDQFTVLLLLERNSQQTFLKNYTIVSELDAKRKMWI